MRLGHPKVLSHATLPGKISRTRERGNHIIKRGRGEKRAKKSESNESEEGFAIYIKKKDKISFISTHKIENVDK